MVHTPSDVPVLVADDASPDDRSRQFLEELDKARVLKCNIYYTRSADNRGFVSTVNDAFSRAAPADVVVLNSDCVVTHGWFDAMKDAANESTLVATVSVLTNHGTILSLPYRNRPQRGLPQTIDLDRAAKEIRSASMRLRPRLPTVVGHCFYVKRAAIDLVGPFDLAFSPGYGEEVDFSQRCVLHGLVHVLADDAFVLHKGSASFAVEGASNPIKEEHDRVIAVRYPYYYKWVDEVATGATSRFVRALGAAERSLRPLTVSIDGRCLTPILTGTQLHTLEVIAAVSREGGLRVRVAVPPDLGEYAHEVLSELPNVTLLSSDAVGMSGERDDVVHRPFQVSSHEDLAFLSSLGERMVLTHQDLIAFNNPGYFASFEEWAAQRRLARHALRLADRVVFFSHVAAAEAIEEEVVERDRTAVVYIGTDHTLDGRSADEAPPKSLAKLEGRPFLLCLGTDFVHKNRGFALRLLAELRAAHGWQGGTVFAGPHVAIGSSASEEAAFLALHPELADVVVDVAAVDEGNKRWLLHHAALMVYPSVHEGFGLIPFEAAEAGLVCAFAPQTSMAELFPRSLALIEPWDARVTAERILPYLHSQRLRDDHIAAVRLSAAPLTWKKTARALIDLYREAAGSPARESRKRIDDFVDERREVERTRSAHEASKRRFAARLDEQQDEFRALQRGYWDLRAAFDETAEALVGREGVIPADLRRPLLAIGHRRSLRVPAFGLVRLLYRTGYRLRHRGRAPER
jgi:GT2 family glycosyltransferase